MVPKDKIAPIGRCYFWYAGAVYRWNPWGNKALNSMQSQHRYNHTRASLLRVIYDNVSMLISNINWLPLEMLMNHWTWCSYRWSTFLFLFLLARNFFRIEFLPSDWLLFSALFRYVENWFIWCIILLSCWAIPGRFEFVTWFPLDFVTIIWFWLDTSIDGNMAEAFEPILRFITRSINTWLNDGPPLQCVIRRRGVFWHGIEVSLCENNSGQLFATRLIHWRNQTLRCWQVAYQLG